MISKSISTGLIWWRRNLLQYWEVQTYFPSCTRKTRLMVSIFSYDCSHS